MRSADPVSVFENKLEESRKILGKLSHDVGGDPHKAWYPLEWSQDAFEAAAAYQILPEAIEVLKDGRDPELVANYYTVEVLRKAQHYSPGSSVSAALVEHYKLRTMAWVVDVIRGNYLRDGSQLTD